MNPATRRINYPGNFWSARRHRGVDIYKLALGELLMVYMTRSVHLISKKANKWQKFKYQDPSFESAEIWILEDGGWKIRPLETGRIIYPPDEDGIGP